MPTVTPEQRRSGGEDHPAIEIYVTRVGCVGPSRYFITKAEFCDNTPNPLRSKAVYHHAPHRQRVTRARKAAPRRDTTCSSSPSCHTRSPRLASRPRSHRHLHSPRNARLSTPASKTRTQPSTRVPRWRRLKASSLPPRLTRNSRRPY